MKLEASWHWNKCACFYYFYVIYLPKKYTGLPKIGLIEEAPISAFPVLQKRPKIAKMTQNDLLSLEMVFTEPLRRTEQNT